VMDYGCIEVPQMHRNADPLAILSSLRAFRDDVLRTGWICGDRAQPADIVLVDGAYQTDIARRFVEESTGGNDYWMTHGYGSRKGQHQYRAPKAGNGRTVGNHWALVPQDNAPPVAMLDADHWKTRVQDGWRAGDTANGTLHVFKAEQRDHWQFAKHQVAERQEEEFIQGKGVVRVWNVVHKHNHWLDCVAGNCAAADMIGIKIMPPQERAAPRPSSEQEFNPYTNRPPGQY